MANPFGPFQPVGGTPVGGPRGSAPAFGTPSTTLTPPAAGGFGAPINKFFSGPTTSTTGSNIGSSTSSGLNTSFGSITPNIPAWYSSFLGSIPGQMQSLAAGLGQNASRPLYGPQQQAAFQNNLNATQGQARQQLLSQLASQGALNSGRATQAETGLALGGQQQLSNYLAQVPQLNAQNALQNNQLLNSLMGQMAGFTSPINAFGSTSTGTNAANNSVASSGASAGNQYVTPNVLGGLGALGIGGLLTYLSQLGGGGSGSNNFMSILQGLGL